MEKPNLVDLLDRTRIELIRTTRDRDALRCSLRRLVDRCDGAEGVRSDGSNICTVDAHGALGNFESLQ